MGDGNGTVPMTKIVQASELKPLQRFRVASNEYLVIDRLKILGILRADTYTSSFRNIRDGSFFLLQDEDRLAVNMTTGELTGIDGQLDVEVVEEKREGGDAEQG